MEKNLSNRADRILESLAGLQKAEAPEFFYTRLIGKMQTATEPEKQPFFLLRPAFITTVLFTVLVLNVISLTHFSKGTSPENKEQKFTVKPASIESFARAYSLDETQSVYE